MKNKISPWTALFFQLICIPSLCLAAEESALSGLREKISRMLPEGAKWSASVIEMETGSIILDEGNTKKVLVPGSLMKLLITGAVLDYSEKHGGWDMKTAMLHDGEVEGKTLKGNIYMRGQGNALLSASDIKTAALRFSNKGIETVSGDIIADDLLFDTKGFERVRKGPAYASVNSLGIDLHTVSVTVTPSSVGKAPDVRVEPPNDNVRFSVSARTVYGTLNTLTIGRIDDLSYKITGDIPEGSMTVSQRFALDSPGFYAAGTFKTLLEKEGITVKGEVKRGKTPDSAIVLEEIEGPSLDSLLRDMNVNSLNVIADNLLLLLGEKRFGAPGSVDRGTKTVGEFLAGFDGLGGHVDEEIKVVDGSGLDKRNRVSSKYMTRYLYEVSRRPWFGRFKSTLPAGGEGTLKSMKFADAQLRAKTGALEDAFAIAGYCAGKNGKELVFTYIANGSSADMAAFQKAGAEIIKTVIGLGGRESNP